MSSSQLWTQFCEAVIDGRTKEAVELQREMAERGLKTRSVAAGLLLMLSEAKRHEELQAQ